MILTIPDHARENVASGHQWGPQGPRMHDLGSIEMGEIDLWGGYRHELRLLQHDFNHPEPC